MERRAQCQCGALSVIAEGEPESVVMCHCKACQRRTGSIAGVVAYYPHAQLRITGSAKRFVRTAESGAPLTNYFCDLCGSTLYVESARHPTGYGIAVGAFADARFPPPQRSVWDESRHSWMNGPAGIPHFQRGRDSARID